jgi:hypothetical protein
MKKHEQKGKQDYITKLWLNKELIKLKLTSCTHVFIHSERVV